MELIIGGAYQGKLEYAQEKLHIDSHFECTLETGDIDFTCGCVTHLERYALSCLRSGKSPVEQLKECENAWQGCVLISDDISQGVVPIDAEMRAWREETGRMLNYLSGKAEHVHRVFLGIGQVIK